jgi:hypothetical protein
MRSKKNQFVWIIKFNPNIFIFCQFYQFSIFQQHLSLIRFPLVLFEIKDFHEHYRRVHCHFPWLIIWSRLWYQSQSFFSFHQQGKFTIELVPMLKICILWIFYSFRFEYKPTFYVIPTGISPIKQWFYFHIPI